jgi:putative ABC transport system ATP-binding protein
MIVLADINRLYQSDEVETTALRSIDLHIRPGEFVAVMGPSGCGKSTLLNIIGTIDRPTSGKYLFADRDVTQLNESELAKLRRDNLGFVFQSFNLIDDLTISENVELGLIYRKWAGKDRRARVGAAMDRVGVAHRARHYPHQLSGGQQQRAAIARAIVGQPSLILADILRALNAEGATIVMVTHSPSHADVAQRRIDMLDGRVVVSASRAM